MSRGRKPGRPRGKGKRKRAPEPDPELAGILAEVPPGQEVIAPQVPMAQPTSLSHMLRDTPARRAAQGLRKNPPQAEGDRALRIEGSEGQVPPGGRSQSAGDRALRIEGSGGRSNGETDLSQQGTGHFGSMDPRGRPNWGRDNNRLKIGHLEARGRSHRRSSMMT